MPKKTQGKYKYLHLSVHENPTRAEHESDTLGYFDSHYEAVTFARKTRTIKAGDIIAQAVAHTITTLTLTFEEPTNDKKDPATTA